MIIIGILGTIFYFVSVLVFMVLYTPICFIVWLVCTPFDKNRIISNQMNTLVGFMLMFLNPFFRIIIHGLDKVDKSETYVIAPNHQAMTDICVLSSTRLRLKWISKKELTYVPFLGWIMAMAKYVLLDRKDPKSQINMMKDSEYFLNNGISIAIFPEGTRSKNNELGKFRDGASLLARKTNRKILPVCNYGIHNSKPLKGLIWMKKVVIHLYFLDPIDPAGYKTKELSNVVKDAISAKLNELKQTNKI